MAYNYKMQEGWDFTAHLAGVTFAANQGREYVGKVEEAIEQLENSINTHVYRNEGVPQFQGYVAEEFSAGTFNIDAVAAGSSDQAKVLHSTKSGSVDVHLKSGADYSMKSFANGSKSVAEQARLSTETREPLYADQHRWVPSDQLDEAKTTASKRAHGNRQDVAKSYSETRDRLTDRIQNDEGVESRTVSRKDLNRMAKAGKKGKFVAEDEGITPASAIKTEYLFKQAVRAGVSAATITAIIQITPEIFKAVSYLVKHGEIDVQRVQRIGGKAISAGAEAFLRGSISCSLLIMCEKGSFGVVLKAISPTLLGTAVAIVMETIKNSILVAAGKMTPEKMGEAFADGVVVSAGFVAGIKAGQAVGGIIGQTLGFELPVIGYVLGSLLGCVFSVVYNIGKKKLISFCVDTGFACFGLVEQSYVLPEDILTEMGVDLAPISRATIERSEVNRVSLGIAADKVDYETVEIKVLRRGIIGVNKIGYVYA